MLATLAINVLAAASIGFQTDTTVVVQPDTRLRLRNFGGDIAIQTWERNAVRIRASHTRRQEVSISAIGAVLAIESRARRGPPSSVDYVLTVPRAMAVDLAGTYASASVRGLRGPLSVNTVNGEIAVQGGSGRVSLSSIQGAIRVRGARGQLYVNTVNGEISLDEIAGKILAETVNGSIALARVLSDSVEATSVNGSLCYDGSVRDGGWYRLATHNGSIAVGLPQNAGATVSVATYGGQFESDFPLKLVEGSRKRFRFSLGSGKAVLQLESFQGTITLRRPGTAWKEGEPPCAADEDNDQEEDPEE